MMLNFRATIATNPNKKNRIKYLSFTLWNNKVAIPTAGSNPPKASNPVITKSGKDAMIPSMYCAPKYTARKEGIPLTIN